MIEIKLNDNVYNITNSLYESILKNNPSLLENRISDKKKMKNDEIKNAITSTLSDVIGKMTDKQKGQFKHLLNKVIEKDGNFQLNTSDDLMKVLSKIKKMDYNSKNPQLHNVLAYDEISKINPTQLNSINKIVQQKVNTNNDSNDLNNNELSNNIGNSFDSNENKTMENVSVEAFLNNDELKNEIIKGEEMALALVKYIKSIVRNRTGAYGSDLQANKSFQDNINKEDYLGYIDDNKAYNYNGTPIGIVQNNNVIITNDSAKGKQVPVNKFLSKDALNASNSVRNRYQASNLGKKATSAAKLMLGGFEIRPIAKNRDDLGLALRFLGDSVDNNSDTLLNKMIMKEFNIKDNIKNKNDVPDKVEKFESMVFNYLQNICYKMSVASTEEFQSILMAMKYDQKIYKSFTVREMNDIRVMNAKRTVVSFIDKNTHNVSLLLIMEPLFARTKELLKGFSPLMQKISGLQG